MNSRELAKLVGPIIVVMTISEMINFQIWQVNIPSLTYLNGMLLFFCFFWQWYLHRGT